MNQMNQTDAIRNKLMTVANSYAQTLQSRPYIVGLVLYGSLARGGLTPFSDVDIVAIYDGKLPDYRCEHRLINDVKVDVIFEQLDKVKDLAARVAHNEESNVSGYFMESLLLGGMDTILFDPTGEIARTKRELNQITNYQRFVQPRASEWFHSIVNENLSKASESLQKGAFSRAIEWAKWAAEGFKDVMQTLTAIKDVKAGADALNIPEFYTIFEKLKRMTSPAKVAVEALWQAGFDLWDYSLKHVYEPIKSKLTDEGVETPEKLELIGDYRLFWPGNRLRELGREIAEVNLSFQWSRYESEHGNISESLDVLWNCRDSETMFKRWKQIGVALKDKGYDVSDIIEQLLDDAEFKRLAAMLDQANQRVKIQDTSASEAELAVILAQQLKTILASTLKRFKTFSRLSIRSLT
jgi:predicted nucleotidyltransferase